MSSSRSLCVQYCHYVAGLVGIGLSRLFSASQLEDPEVGRDTELANSMGLFLQKTNIIRDYLEDTQVGRAFWPQEVERVPFCPAGSVFDWNQNGTCFSRHSPSSVDEVLPPGVPRAGLESVRGPSGGLCPSGEAGVGSLLSQPAGHRRSEARSGRHRLPVPPAQPERLQFLCHSAGDRRLRCLQRPSDVVISIYMS